MIFCIMILIVTVFLTLDAIRALKRQRQYYLKELEKEFEKTDYWYNKYITLKRESR